MTSTIEFTAALGCKEAADQLPNLWWVANSWVTVHDGGGISTRLPSPDELEQRAAEDERLKQDLAALPKNLRETVTRYGGIERDVEIKARDIGAKNRDGLMRCLEHIGVALRYNTRSALMEVTDTALTWQPISSTTPILSYRLSDKVWGYEKQRRVDAIFSPFDGRLQDFIREMLPRYFFYKVKGKADEVRNERLIFGRDKWNEALGAISYMTEADPLVEWLETLPAWDGTPRLDSWLGEIFKLEPGEGNRRLAAWGGRHIFLGVVWRSFEPGTKMDEILVIAGPGGIGKSTTLAHIFPENTRGKYFTDGLKLAADPKERVEATQGRALVEASEMSGVTRADNDDVNGYISAVDDGNVRLAYRRDPEPTPRRFIIVGTSHRPSFLPNEENLRRFVPVYCRAGRFNSAEGVRSYLDRNRDQLWAEAIHLYRQDVEARLPESLKKLQRAATGRARSADIIMEDAVEDWVNVANGVRTAFTIGELAVGIGLVTEDAAAKLAMRDQHRIGTVLYALGFTPKRRKREDGTRLRVWDKD